MTVSSVGSSSSSSASGTASASGSNAALGLDFTQYLSILTTQLQNQDPTNATDPNQYTQELVEMEGVQQQINTDADLKSLVTAESASSLSSGVGYIGNVVQSASSNGEFELQNGYAQFGYTLPSAAASTVVTIQDSTGATVATLAGGTASGTNSVSWDGENASGTAQASGQYTFTVAATDSNGNTLTSTNPVIFSQITGVSSNSDGTLTLIAGPLATSTSSSGTSSVGSTSGTNLSISSTDVTAIYTTSTVPSATSATVTG